MTPEEEEAYRQKVRAEFAKDEEARDKARIRKEEEVRAQGGSTVVAVKKIWKLVLGK